MDTFELLIYHTAQEDASIEVVLRDETIWATQKAMAQLFGVQVPAISKHIKNIYTEGELKQDATLSKMETVVNRGIRGEVPDTVEIYNLDMIIAVGYRVSSMRATQFRIWATTVLTEYIKKGFAIDDKRMKAGGTLFGKDYFREMLDKQLSLFEE